MKRASDAGVAPDPCRRGGVTMQITWLGHSAFLIELDDTKLIIDPFLSGNPAFDGEKSAVLGGLTHCVLTHGHADHTGDVMDIAPPAAIFSNYEIFEWLRGKGIAGAERLQPMNTGGTVTTGPVSVTLVRADHSSAQGGVALGNCNGAIIRIGEAPAIWHLGDTDIFSDMALICDIHRPKVAIVPIGDRFTMGPEVAAMAVKRFMPGVEVVLPCHYGSFPPLVDNADRFVTALTGIAAKVLVPKVGEPILI